MIKWTCCSAFLQIGYIKRLKSCSGAAGAASSDSCKVPSGKTSFAQTAFSVKEAKSWNYLSTCTFLSNFTSLKGAATSCKIQQQTTSK